MSGIKQVRAREVLDARGDPTIEVEVRLDDRSFGRASVPTGASPGSREAIELRDGDPARFGGRGVSRAVTHVNVILDSVLQGADALAQDGIDRVLNEVDGTQGKVFLGANAILGVSLAVARAAAASSRQPLYRHLGGASATRIPVPMFCLLSGGLHTHTHLDIEELMVVPMGANSFAEALRMGVEVFHSMRDVLKQQELTSTLSDDGGYVAPVRSHDEAFDLMLLAIAQAGLRAGPDMVIAVDCAATAFRQGGVYRLRREGWAPLKGTELVELYAQWVAQYPIRSIEDGMAEDDRAGWELLTKRLGDHVQLVGDDLFATNWSAIRTAAQEGLANAALIRPNQAGTLTETRIAATQAHSSGYGVIVAGRSGETVDDFIADLAVALRADQFKAGGACRGEHVAKYNQLLRIEEELGRDATYAGADLLHPVVPRKTKLNGSIQ